ncbi:MAG: right-handed parallel beta-helix repeat-containing protein, partial [Planctomycetota bacterium]
MEAKKMAKSGGKGGIFVVIVVLAVVCVGAEVGYCRKITVRADGSGDYPTIQAAIDDVNDGDEVVLEPGTYTGPGNRNIDFLGKAITVRSTDPNDASAVASTVIRCDGTSSARRRGFLFHSGEDANSVVDGVTIRKGYGTYGGAICCDQSSPLIRNCTIKSNTANLGGGIYCTDSNMVVVNCTITDNTAQGTNYVNGGGGVYLDYGGSPTVSKCAISNNTAAWAGGVSCYGGTITDCVIAGNSANGDPGWGGAIHGLFGPTTISNCIITDNSAKLGGGIFSIVRRGNSRIVGCLISGNKASSGGGFYCYEGELAISGCTIVGNSASGIRCAEEGSAAVNGCVLWGNRANSGSQVSLGGGTSISISYSDIQGGQDDIHIGSGAVLSWRDGNIDILPHFVEAGFWDTGDVWVEGDYHLREDSPCIDAGDPNYAAEPNEMDLDGNPRVVGGRIDMGAYEFIISNTAPVACVAGGDRVVEAGEDCEGRVVLDGSCSSDADSTAGTNDDINNFDWYEVIDVCEPNSDIYLGSGEVIECNLGLGEHLIILEVTDKAGAFDSNEVVITVEDVTPPEFSLFVEPNVLWPPNHRMVRIEVSWEVSDNCDEQVEVSLV